MNATQIGTNHFSAKKTFSFEFRMEQSMVHQQMARTGMMVKQVSYQ